jgi:hypothetical protein
MAQFLRPTSDVSVGTWTTAPLWSKLDEASADDGDFVQSALAPTGTNPFEVALNTPSAPRTGTRTIRVRRRKSVTSSRAMDLTVSLIRNTTVVQSFSDNNIPTSLTTQTFTLTNTPAGWDDLRIRIAATQAAATTTAPTFVGAGTESFTATNGANLTPTLPSGWAADDIHILLVARGDNTAITTPSGWTKITPSSAAETNTSALIVSVYWRRAVGGDTAPTVTAGTSTVVRGAVIFGVRGCPTGVDPFAFTNGGTRSNNAASATVASASMTPSEGNTFNLFLMAYEDDPNTFSQPSGGWSVSSDVGSSLGNDMAFGWSTLTQTTAAALNPSSTVSGGSFANSPNVGILLSFKGIPVPDARAEVSWVEVEIPDPPTTHAGTLTVDAAGDFTAAGEEIISLQGRLAFAQFTANELATGGETHSGTLAVSAEGTYSATNLRLRSAVSTLSGEGGTVANARAIRNGVASYSGVGSFVPTGIRLFSGTAPYSAATDTSLFAVALRGGATSYSGVGSFALTGVRRFGGTASYSAASDTTLLTAVLRNGVTALSAASNASLVSGLIRPVSLVTSAEGIATLAARRNAVSGATWSAEGTLATLANAIYRRDFDLAAEGVLSPTARRTLRPALTIDAEGQLVAVPYRVRSVLWEIGGNSNASLSTRLTARPNFAPTAEGVSFFSFGEGQTHQGTITLDALSNAVTLARVLRSAGLPLTAETNLTTSVQRTIRASAAYDSTGAFSSSAYANRRGSFSLDSDGAIVANGARTITSILPFSAASDVTVTTIRLRVGLISFSSATDFIAYSDTYAVLVGMVAAANFTVYPNIIIEQAAIDLSAQSNLVFVSDYRALLAPPGLFRDEYDIPLAFVGAELANAVALMRGERLVPAAILAHAERVVPVALLTDEHDIPVVAVIGDHVVPVLITREEIETALALIREESGQIGIP